MTCSKFLKVSAAVAAALSISACIPGGGGGDSEGGVFGMVLTTFSTPNASVNDGADIAFSWSGMTYEDDIPVTDYTFTIYANSSLTTGGVPVVNANCSAIGALANGTCAVTTQFVGDDITYSSAGALNCTADNVAGTLDCGFGAVDVSDLLVAGNGSLYFMGQINSGTASPDVQPVLFNAVTPTAISDAGGTGDVASANFDIAATGSQVTQGVTTTKADIVLGSAADMATDNNMALGTEEYRWQLLFDTNANNTVDAGEKSIALVYNSNGTTVAGTMAMASMTGQIESGAGAIAGVVTVAVDAATNTLSLSAANLDLGLVGGETPVILTNDAVNVVSDSSAN